MSFAWSSKMKMLWEKENGSLIKTSLFASLFLKCHAEKQHFIYTANRNLCAWQIEWETKKRQSIQLSNTYMGWWFKLQSFKNLALSKLEPCPGFFFFFLLNNKFRNSWKKKYFARNTTYKQHLHFEWVQNAFGMKGSSLPVCFSVGKVSQRLSCLVSL